MRTITETYNVYKFSELSPKAQDTVLDKLYDINIDHDWWDCTYDDARNVGIEIEELDTGSRNMIRIKLLNSPESIAKSIIKDHGPDCGTTQVARDYLKANVDIRDDSEFKRAIGEEYLSILRRKSEYLTSREAIIETIEANGYEFLENGTMI